MFEQLEILKQLKMVKQWLAEQKKGTRVMQLLLTAVVTVYVVCVLWLLPQMMRTVPMDTKYWKVKILAAVLALVPVFLFLLWATFRCREKKLVLESSVAGRSKKTLLLWFFAAFLLVFLWLMLYYYAYFPGSFDWDNLDQWWQIQNHQYDTWHPVFHTLLIGFFAKFVNHYGFAVFMQLFLYSLLCGYLIYTMARWNFPAWSLALTEFFLAANPQTHRILLFMWKDSALTLFMVLFTSYLINVWMTRGEWLKRNQNRILWVLVLLSISLVRHNSILFTIPFLLLGALSVKEIRKECAVSLLVMLAGMWLIQNPGYDLVNASRPEQTYVETVGVPMTVLCNIHEEAPESLSPGAADFLGSIGPEKRWKIYELGNYNSFKFVTNANAVISETDPKEFLSFTLDTVRRAPGLSLQAVYQVTRMVWDVRGEKPWHGDLEFQLRENEWNFAYVTERSGLRETLNDFDHWVMENPVDLLFSYNGLHLLVLILCALMTFPRKGWKVLWAALPLLAYSYGTMLLLCGPTYRFFHFNSVIFIPISLLFFAEQKKDLC